MTAIKLNDKNAATTATTATPAVASVQNANLSLLSFDPLAKSAFSQKMFYFSARKKDSEPPRVLVIDDFKTKNIPIGQTLTTHGDLVTAQIKHFCPAAKIKEAGLMPTDPENMMLGEGIIKGLKEAAAKYSRYDGINISQSFPFEPEAFENFGITGKNIATPNVKEDLRALIMDSNGVIPMAETLAKTSPVYIAAGNNGTLNELSLARGVNVIGALDTAEGKKPAAYSSEGLSTNYALGTLNVKAIKNGTNEIIGYNVSGGENIDISAPPNTNPNIPLTNITGTSFAAPRALGEYLRTLYINACGGS